MFTVGILTISDKGSRGERADESGNKVIREMAAACGGQVIEYNIVPDEKDQIAAKLSEWADSGRMDVVLTTGGTGLGPRDVTPEAMMLVVDRVIPGIGEAMRIGTLSKTPMAMLSRAIAGQRKKCLIVNLPGSPRAVEECLEIALKAIPHAVEIITGVVTEHKIQGRQQGGQGGH